MVVGGLLAVGGDELRDEVVHGQRRRVHVRDALREGALPPRKHHPVPLTDQEEYLRTAVSSIGFLDRKNISLSLEPWSEPYRVSVRVKSDREFVLFDASFPYSRTPGGTEYSILIGVNPPLPLNLELTIPRNRTFTVEVTLEYLRPPEGYSLEWDHISVSSRLRFRKNLEIKT